MAAKIKVELQANNIGPHVNLDTSFDTGSLQLGIFANNGSGKTFISRIFRLIMKENISVKDVNRLLTINQSQGSFRFSVRDNDQGKNVIISSFDISLKRNTLPVINYDKKYIFHVFNDEYIKENLEELRYKPNGNIEGYILGKEKIDISNEKLELDKLNSDLKKKEDLILKSISSAKKELEELGIRSQTKEFSHFTYENIINDAKPYINFDNFEQLKNKLHALKSTPDNLPDLENVTLSINSNSIFKIQDYIETKFNRSDIAEEFKIKIREKQYFIEQGLLHLDSSLNKCPFCEQSLKEESLLLIDQYNKYLNDSEAKVIKDGDSILIFLNNLETDLEKLSNNYIKLKDKYLYYKEFISSIVDSLENLESTNELSDNIYSLKKIVEEKKSNISVSITHSRFGSYIDFISEYTTNCIKSININKSLIDNANKKKNNLQNERLEINRKLIIAKYYYLKDNLKVSVQELNKIRIEIQSLEKDIKEKEESERVDKRLKVAEFFIHYLKTFFKNKYSFDEENFCLKFQNNILSDNATDVLSEGEKSIVAFCYYLAEIHKVVNQNEDYEKLFLIIDDPISSLDFHYVYAVTQIIRDLGWTFSIKRVRFLIMTHNIEFMSILIRNRIINHKYSLSAGKIGILRRELIMPYEEHLRDIYDVYNGTRAPSHTTPNSIRHVLETVNRFISPDLELQAFCQSIPYLDECEFLYTLIQDNSHGSIRIQKAYTDESISDGCRAVIDYIGLTFKGQLNNITLT